MKIVNLVLAVVTVATASFASSAQAGVVSCPKGSVFGDLIVNQELISHDGEMKALVQARINQHNCDIRTVVLQTSVILLDKNGIRLPLLPQFQRFMKVTHLDSNNKVLNTREPDAPSVTDQAVREGLDTLLVEIDGFEPKFFELN